MRGLQSFLYGNRYVLGQKPNDNGRDHTLIKGIEMRLSIILFAVITFVSTASAESWTCSAPGMVSGSYDGGTSAYVHLGGFPSGGSYPVQKNGKRATRTTKNGTRFTCVQK
jgi:hypothetical protein